MIQTFRLMADLVILVVLMGPSTRLLVILKKFVIIIQNMFVCIPT